MEKEKTTAAICVEEDERQLEVFCYSLEEKLEKKLKLLDKLRFFLFILDVMLLCYISVKTERNMQLECIDLSGIVFWATVCSMIISWCQVFPAKKKVQENFEYKKRINA